jgi:hypothetical protein
MQRDIWREGKYIDLWSLVHLLSGFILAGWLSFIGAPLHASVGIATIIFAVWEIFEHVYKIEVTSNQITDLIVNYVGFFIFYLTRDLFLRGAVSVVAITTIITLLLSLSGFLAFMRRKTRGLLKERG